MGGEVTTAVLNNMKTFGRISACGSVSSYNDAVPKSIIKFTIIIQHRKSNEIKMTNLHENSFDFYSYCYVFLKKL